MAETEERLDIAGVFMITPINVATAALKLVACDAIPTLLENAIVANLVTRDFEPVVNAHGDSLAQLFKLEVLYGVAIEHDEWMVQILR